ncbi:MAG: leucyl-tRNA synthetase, partial [Patescibacteria group bacterium]|nr:leucyl-tRNA synthetase [Patescibacteria group bacterium]
ESYEPINWCPSCQTGLANEDLEDGKCERCGSEIEKKPMRQWVLRITDYADRLLNDLSTTDYDRPKIIDKTNPPAKGLPLVERRVAHAIVFNPKTKQYLIIRNKKHGWDTVVIGGIEEGETAEQAARREVKEETGYTDLEFKRVLGGETEAHYFAKHKGENRLALAQGVLFELKSDARVDIADGEDADNEILWIDEEDFVPGKMINAELPVWLERLKNTKLGWPEPLLEWPESIKEAQRNWIGRSEGLLFTAPVKDTDITIQTFSAHFEAFYADTFVVIAPDHPLLPQLVAGTENENKVLKFSQDLVKKRIKDGFNANKEPEGIFTGRYIVDPVGNGDLPIWVANFAIADYGTGIVKASCHDERDFAFAKKYNIKMKPVLFPVDETEKKKVKDLEICYFDMKNGVLTEPSEFAGKRAGDYRNAIADFAVEKGLAVKKVSYKLRDWVFSRQRYWGEPIPLIHCEKCGVVAVPEKDLPVELPKVKSYAPTGTGESPLADIKSWVNTKCPTCKGPAKRETNTMPQWAGSSWYYLRYMDPHNKKSLVDTKKEKYWSPVDLYVGGTEHATRHLIYARFWHKFLNDIGTVSTNEPFKKFGKSLGLVLGEDGRKMSKRWGNVVNPDDVVAKYGADTMRLYEMFMGPFDQEISWNTQSMIGTRRFLEKVWKLGEKVGKKTTPDISVDLHRTIKKVGEDIENFNFNTAVSSLMILANSLEKCESISKTDFETLIKLLAPFSPHIVEELWLDKGSVHQADWPRYDESKTISETVTIVIQVNGKMRGSITVRAGTDEGTVVREALASDRVSMYISGQEIKKTIFVPNKLLNFVV